MGGAFSPVPAALGLLFVFPGEVGVAGVADGGDENFFGGGEGEAVAGLGDDDAVVLGHFADLEFPVAEGDFLAADFSPEGAGVGEVEGEDGFVGVAGVPGGCFVGGGEEGWVGFEEVGFFGWGVVGWVGEGGVDADAFGEGVDAGAAVEVGWGGVFFGEGWEKAGAVEGAEGAEEGELGGLGVEAEVGVDLVAVEFLG